MWYFGTKISAINEKVYKNQLMVFSKFNKIYIF